MAETADDLSTPLGQETVTKKRRRLRLPFSATQAIAVLMGLFLLAFLGFAIFNDNPFGGEPGTRVAIRQATPAEKSAMAPAGVQAPVRYPSSANRVVLVRDLDGDGRAVLRDPALLIIEEAWSTFGDFPLPEITTTTSPALTEFLSCSEKTTSAG